jgi:hypothetical protein
VRLAAILVALPLVLRAQPGTGALAGTVRDSLGNPVRMVAVVVDGSDIAAVTDDSGRFHLKGIRAGKNGFTTRRVGFGPVEFETTIEANKTLVLDIRMNPLVNTLAPVAITAEALKRFESTGFGARRKGGIGSYVGPERVDSMMDRVTSAAMLLRNLRGLEVSCKIGFCSVTTRNGPTCLNVFVNGGFRQGQLDENVQLSEVYAIEVYEKAVLVPSEFQGKLPMKVGRGLTTRPAGCGAIAVWTRGRAAP